ncbi:MAG: DUF4239 domain-containing protein [Desulfovibrio sp.]|nr:DUF4239 domain-containing protein [Desulfovibrio sp.]MBI4959626.1 DUF4239 domain-containing protein [Desulfovibrio sp.]
MFTELKGFNPEYLVVFSIIFGLSLAIPALLYALRRPTLKATAASRKLISSEIFSLFATVYAFFLGFSIVTLWGTFVSAKNSVNSEAGAVLVSYHLSMPLENSRGFRQTLEDYTKSVVDDEWPIMDGQRSMSEQSLRHLDEIWEAFYRMKPADKESYSLYASVGQSLAEISRHRLSRAQTLSGNLYPPVWVILWFGVFGVFVGLLLTNPEQTGSQVAMEVIIVFLILSCVYFIVDISTPFSGVLNVSPEPFQNIHAKIITLQGVHP